MVLKLKDSWTLVNFSIINHLLKENLCNNHFNIELEKKISDPYKADLICLNEQTSIIHIIETKVIISLSDTALIPFNSGTRAIRHLRYFSTFLKNKATNIEYAFILMSPFIKKLEMNQKDKEFCELYKLCLKRGMPTKSYQVHISPSEITLACNAILSPNL